MPRAAALKPTRNGEKANVSSSTANDGYAAKDDVPAGTAHAVTAPAVTAPAVMAPAAKNDSVVQGTDANEDDKDREKEGEVVNIDESGTAGADAESGGDVINIVGNDISKDSRNASQGDLAKKKAEAKKNHEKSDSSDATRSRNDQCRLFWQGKCPFGTSGRSSSDGSKCESWHPKKCQKFVKFGFKEGGCKDKKCLELHPKICFKNMQGKRCNKIDCTFLHPQSYVVQQMQGQKSNPETNGDKKSAEKGKSEVDKNKKKHQQPSPPQSTAEAKNNKGRKQPAGAKGNQENSLSGASKSDGHTKKGSKEEKENANDGNGKMTPDDSPFHEFRLQLMQMKEQMQTIQAMQQWLLTSMRPFQSQHPMQPLQAMQPMGLLANQAMMTPFAR